MQSYHHNSTLLQGHRSSRFSSLRCIRAFNSFTCHLSCFTYVVHFLWLPFLLFLILWSLGGLMQPFSISLELSHRVSNLVAQSYAPKLLQYHYFSVSLFMVPQLPRTTFTDLHEPLNHWVCHLVHVKSLDHHSTLSSTSSMYAPISLYTIKYISIHNARLYWITWDMITPTQTSQVNVILYYEM